MSTPNKPNANRTNGGVSKRRAGGSPQRPFVVATNTASSKSPAATKAPAAKPAAKPTPQSQPTKSEKVVAVAQVPAESAASVRRSLPRVTAYALARYVRNPWFAIDAVLLLALFFLCYNSTFNTFNFFTSAAFLVGGLSAISAYGLVHGVIAPEDALLLGRERGPIATVGGLALAAIALRAAYAVVFVLLSLIFHRFYGLQAGPFLAALLGLIIACAFVATVIVTLSTPFVPLVPRIAALALLMLGFASFNATDLLGTVLFVARIPLFPFVAPYRLAVVPNDLLAWLGTVLLAPAAIVGLILLCAFWFRQILATTPETATNTVNASPAAVAR